MSRWRVTASIMVWVLLLRPSISSTALAVSARSLAASASYSSLSLWPSSSWSALRVRMTSS